MLGRGGNQKGRVTGGTSIETEFMFTMPYHSSAHTHTHTLSQQCTHTHLLTVART